MAENVKIIYAPKERSSSEREARGVTTLAAPAAVGQWQWASGSGPQRQRAMLREPDAGSYYLVHADDV